MGSSIASSRPSLWSTLGFDGTYERLIGITERFRDFVLTRIAKAQFTEGEILETEDREADDQWMRVVELELAPHPGLAHPEAIERDFDMRDGVLRARLRAALVGYALLHWSVDATPDHRLPPERHPLWLRNPAALYGVDNLSIAPGWPL